MSQEIEYIDAKDSENPFEHGSEGVVYVAQPHAHGGYLREIDTFAIESWRLGPAKSGDVGMDIPVRIRNTYRWPHVVRAKLHPPALGHINFEEGWIDIPAGSYARLPSGLHVKMPDDAWIMVRPRSSTGFKRFMTSFEGTIDSGYTGHLMCLVYNRYNLICRTFAFVRSAVCGILATISPKLSKWVAERTNWGCVRIKDGECLVQLVLIPKYPLKKIVDVKKLPETARGASGFGSSGN